MSIKKTMGVLFVAAVVLFLFAMPGQAQDDEAVKQRKMALEEFFSKYACADCHGAQQSIPLFSARAQYMASGHKKNGNAFYANGAGCQKCHTHEGFLEFVATGKVDEEGGIKHPTQPGCFTCHEPHKTGDFSLRTDKPVTLANNAVFDKGHGNLCAVCHTIRTDVKQTVKAVEASKFSPHFGPHHGPQADMFVGEGGWEYEGKTYYNSVHSTLTQNSCLDCHKTLPEGRFSLAAGIGGHSFSIGGDVHHEEKLNVAGCLGKCHTQMKAVKAPNEDAPGWYWWHDGELVFETEAKADFDNDGKVEPLQSEIDGLLNLLVNKSGTGYLQQGELPLYNKEGNWNFTMSTEQRTVEQVAAVWNYKFVAEDRSRGIHNAPYAIQLLYDTIETMDPKFDVSKRNTYLPPEQYKPAETK